MPKIQTAFSRQGDDTGFVWTQKVGHNEMDEFKRHYISRLSDLRPYEYRRRHIETDAVQLLKAFMDRVFFLVLDKNPALKFWKKCFLDYKEFSHPEIISQPYERYYCYKRI